MKRIPPYCPTVEAFAKAEGFTFAKSDQTKGERLRAYMARLGCSSEEANRLLEESKMEEIEEFFVKMLGPRSPP